MKNIKLKLILPIPWTMISEILRIPVPGSWTLTVVAASPLQSKTYVWSATDRPSRTVIVPHDVIKVPSLIRDTSASDNLSVQQSILLMTITRRTRYAPSRVTLSHDLVSLFV